MVVVAAQYCVGITNWTSPWRSLATNEWWDGKIETESCSHYYIISLYDSINLFHGK